MNLKKYRILYLLAVLSFAWCAVRVSATKVEKAEYVCTPCANECDHRVYDQPGSCPVCGMPLVEKASLQSEQASRAMDLPLAQEVTASEMKVAIFIFDGVQIIDYTGPFEVFGHAGFEIFTVAEKAGAITTAMGMSVNPKYTFENYPTPDILLLPGGNVPDQLTTNVAQWIRQNAERSKIVLSVCNGAFFLARTGLLDGLEATTFAALIDPLRIAAPKTKVVSNKRFVDNGKIITTAGLSSGIDGSLHVIEKMLGRSFAQVVATALEYNWDPAGKYVRAALADKQLQNTFRFMRSFDREIVTFGGNADEWTAGWNIRTALSPAAVLDSLGKNLSTVDKWQPVTSKSSNSSSWRFSDANGQDWVGQANVDTSGGEKNKLTLTIKVIRGSAKTAQK